MMAEEQSYKAVVQKVISSGPHGPYAVAKSDEFGSVTFSLKPPVWREKFWPERGTVVVLSDVRRKRAGWRAELGRFMRPSDEQSAKS